MLGNNAKKARKAKRYKRTGEGKLVTPRTIKKSKIKKFKR